MGLSGRDIVCFSTHYWDERRFRKQEFMSRFSENNRVLFVEPSYSMARRPEDHVRQQARNRLLRSHLSCRGQNLWLLQPPRGLPKWTVPRVERSTYQWFAHLVGGAVRQLGFREAILWLYRPSYVFGLDRVPHQHVVFDLVDDLSAYGGSNYPLAGHIEQTVDALIRRSDLLIVTAKTLADRYRGVGPPVVQVPNGYDGELFRSDTEPVELPVSGPVLGFAGTLFPFLDFDLLERVARVHTDKSLVLVGPVESSARELVTQLVRQPNVFHLGGRPQAAIPAHIAAFDVCLNPFTPGLLADSVNPLKVFEYLALGKPVVSTEMRALRRETVASEILFASDAADFCRKIDDCLKPEVKLAAAQRRSIVEDYQWDRLFARLDETCQNALT